MSDAYKAYSVALNEVMPGMITVFVGSGGGLERDAGLYTAFDVSEVQATEKADELIRFRLRRGLEGGVSDYEDKIVAEIMRLAAGEQIEGS